MSIVLSFGRYGGFYINRGYSFRVCLGCIALTVIPQDFDILIKNLKEG